MGRILRAITYSGFCKLGALKSPREILLAPRNTASVITRETLANIRCRRIKTLIVVHRLSMSTVNWLNFF